jgi:uncharacterized Ntn-hydrolase superfamily protein
MLAALLSMVAMDLAAQQPQEWEGRLRVGTFSIAAVDAETGEIGIAVTSRVACIGSIVPHVREGVGVVATQALIRMEYGDELLKLLEAGTSPADALKQALAADPLSVERQIGIITANGRSAQHTGHAAIPWAGQRAGRGYIAQGNVLVGADVLAAVARTFERTENTGRRLAERLIEALAAGDEAGGDRRKGALQSAAMVVADPRPGRAARPDRISVDIDICESEDPVRELKRVYNSVSGNLGYRTLQQFHGADVVQLKIILHALGYFRPQEADLRMELSAPFLTQEVVNAVNAFREAHKLSGPASGSPPGLVDAETIELMWEALEQQGKAAEVRRRIRDLNRG